eukprot:2569651-Amphidinium_carterae.2
MKDGQLRTVVKPPCRCDEDKQYFSDIILPLHHCMVKLLISERGLMHVSLCLIVLPPCCEGSRTGGLNAEARWLCAAKSV